MKTTTHDHQYKLVFALAVVIGLTQAHSLAYHSPALRPFQSATNPARKPTPPIAQSRLVLKAVTIPVWCAPNNKGLVPVPLSLQITNRGDKPVAIPVVGALRVLLMPVLRSQTQHGSTQASEPLPFKTGGDTGIVAPQSVRLAPGKN